MQINMELLMAALTLMWQGMLGIFAVMAVISIVVWIFTKVGSRKSEK